MENWCSLTFMTRYGGDKRKCHIMLGSFNVKVDVLRGECIQAGDGGFKVLFV